MIQSIQESQANLQAELNAVKRNQSSHQDSGNKHESQDLSSKHYLQSPVKMRYEKDPTDNEEDKKYRAKRAQDEQQYVQTSPYSPPRQRDYSRSYEDVDAPHGRRDKDGGDKNDVSKRNPYSNVAVHDSLNKKYDFSRSEQTKNDSPAKDRFESTFQKKRSISN